MSTSYEGKQYVGIDLHRRRWVIVRQTESGESLGWVRIDNDPVALALEIEKSGRTRRWCWRPPTAGCDVRVGFPS